MRAHAVILARGCPRLFGMLSASGEAFVPSMEPEVFEQVPPPNTHTTTLIHTRIHTNITHTPIHLIACASTLHRGCSHASG